MLNVEVDDSRSGAALTELAGRLEDIRVPLLDIAEYLHQSTDDRFRKQVSPDGAPWAPLAASTVAKKKSSQILRQDGFLQDTIRHRVSGDELELGSDRPYAAIHQFGGKIEQAARSQQVYFKQKGGEVGNRFVKKRQSNFAQWVTRGATSTEMPARPYLGLSSEDDNEILAIVSDYLSQPFEAGPR